MLSLLKRKSKKIFTVENLLQDDPKHEWIRSDKSVYRFFKEVLTDLSLEDFATINEDKAVTFIYSAGKYASAISETEKRNYIIIYPELISLIKSVDNTIALAIIFHELGHLYHKHANRTISALEKEQEADSFACKYGLKDALLGLLKAETRTFEIVSRINAATEFQYRSQESQ